MVQTSHEIYLSLKTICCGSNIQTWLGGSNFSCQLYLRPGRRFFTCHPSQALSTQSSFWVPALGVRTPLTGAWWSLSAAPLGSCDFFLHLRPYPLPFLYSGDSRLGGRNHSIWTYEERIFHTPGIPYSVTVLIQSAHNGLALSFGNTKLSPPGTVLKIPRQSKASGTLGSSSD